MTDTTVAAVSTPRAAGGIAVIRISGEKALDIADKIFVPLSSGKKPSQMEGYTCAYGNIVSGEEILDDGIVTVFRAPKSFTGENVAEISCHGGIFITERILRAIFENGAEPAPAGEFTKRAFLKGKYSLTQAEAVADIISAEGRAFCRRAENVKNGALYRKIKVCSDELAKILGGIGAWIDYPDEDIPEVDGDTLKNSLNGILSELKKISASYDDTRILKSGIETVIAGKPNVGKSTLMNLLAGCEKSIVTSIPGTTRDIIEESVRIGDIVLRLSDTAGLRESGDIAEGIGIERAKEKIKQADLIIAVFDSSTPLDDGDRQLMELCRDLPCVNRIACVNKSDMESRICRDEIDASFEYVADISAKNGEGLDNLKNILYNIYLGNKNVYDDINVNERQKICLDRAAESVSEALSALCSGVTLDAVNVVLDDALNALLELSGERAGEAVVNEIFSHFCVGK